MDVGHWYDEAACRGEDVELFYSEHPDDVATALGICRGCPVRQPCLERAFADREFFGVWGGVSGAVRRRAFRRDDRRRRREEREHRAA